MSKKWRSNEVKRQGFQGYWDESLWVDGSMGAWLESAPHPSAEDEFLASLEPEKSPAQVDEFVLHDALKILTTRQRFVIELRYGMRDGCRYSQTEIAEMMGITQQAVLDHEQAAVARLQKRLVDESP